MAAKNGTISNPFVNAPCWGGAPQFAFLFHLKTKPLPISNPVVAWRSRLCREWPEGITNSITSVVSPIELVMELDI
jgi:hypothetical protein